MKKRIFGGLALITIGIVATFHLNMNAEINSLSALSLANIEALASEASEGETSTCHDSKNVAEENGTGEKFLVCASGTTSSHNEDCDDDAWREGRLINKYATKYHCDKK